MKGKKKTFHSNAIPCQKKKGIKERRKIEIFFSKKN